MAKAKTSNKGSVKHQLIDKNNSRLLVTVSIAVFVLIFSIVASKQLISQAAYQNRVITKKRKADDQLKKDIEVVKKLHVSYAAFVDTSQNVLGGNVGATGEKDGDNAKIILDALPSKYDFPALTTSLETLVNGQGAQFTSLSGTDDEVAQAPNQSSSDPTPIPMPFQLSATGDYGRVQGVINAFEKSIRPIKVGILDVSGNQDKLTVNVTGESYYQPAKSLNTRTEVVK